jgi:hypothetical protein
MPNEALGEEQQNRILRKQLELIFIDQKRLIEELEELEELHMNLVRKDIPVDWDLQYTSNDFDRPLEDGHEIDFKLEKINLTDELKPSLHNGNADSAAEGIVALELKKLYEVEEIYATGAKLKLNPTKEMGPTRYHGINLRSI